MVVGVITIISGHLLRIVITSYAKVNGLCRIVQTARHGKWSSRRVSVRILVKELQLSVKMSWQADDR